MTTEAGKPAGTPPEGGKETPKQPTVDELQSQLAKLQEDNRELLKETMSRKEKIRDLEAKHQQAEETKLKEQEKYKELYEQVQPQVDRLKEIEPKLQTMLDAEVDAVPEDKRNLIPNFQHPEQKLEWLQQANKANFFAVQEPKKEAPPASVQSKVNSDGTLPDFVSWKADDPRIGQLPTEKYKVWVQHNRPAKKVTGWGG